MMFIFFSWMGSEPYQTIENRGEGANWRAMAGGAIRHRGLNAEQARPNGDMLGDTEPGIAATVSLDSLRSEMICENVPLTRPS
jgi:hypothetical protein